MNIALGTAQFGFSYGIANTNGKVTNEMAKKILSRAKEANINTLDTAISYGESEQCLGNAGVGGWNLITKLPPIPENCLDVTDWVNCQINASLQRLKAESIMAIMLHRPKQLLESNGRCLWAALQALKNKGVEVHSRSVFLQGVLLHFDDLPDYFSTWQVQFERYQTIVEKSGLSSL